MATRSSNAIVLRPQSSRAVPVRRKASGPNKKTEQLKKRLQSLRRRASTMDTDQKMGLLTVGAPVALSMLKRQTGFSLPSIFGLNPNLAWGGLFALVGPSVVKGDAGRMLSAAGYGMAAVGGTEAATAGSIFVAAAKKKKKTKVAGDDEVGDDEIGDDEIGDDEIGDDEIGDDDD